MNVQVVYSQYRICLQYQRGCKNIFNTLVNEILISKMIFECVSVEVPVNDNVVNVCDNCTMKLATAYQLRLQMIESDLYLRNLKEKVELDENNKCENKDKIQSVDVTTNHCIENEAIKEEPGQIEEMTKEESNEERYSSPICKESSNNDQHHVEEHSEIKPHTCTMCNENFLSRKKFFSHIFAHSTVKSHACQVCGKLCKTVFALTDHMQGHSGIKCNICFNTFINKRSLIKHRKRIHSIDEINYHLCKVCGRDFYAWADYRLHVISHNEKSILCTTCGKMFRHPKTAKMHWKNHRAEQEKKTCL